MKTYKELNKKHLKNIKDIDTLTNEIIELEKRHEIHAAALAGNYEHSRALRVEADKTLDIQRKKSEKILLLEVENQILQDNEKAALFAEYLPVIADILKPYENKPFGDRTREKIRAAAHEKGFWFYFDGRIYTRYIKIGFLNSNGYNDYTMPEIEMQTKYDTPFIDADNKIHFTGLDISIYEKYVEDVSGRAKSILKAFNAYKAAAEKARTLETALNNQLPNSMSSFRKINDIYDLLRG